MKSITSSLLLLVLFIGFSGPRKITAAKFQEEYAGMKTAHSVRSTTYLGQRDGTARLRIGSMNLFTQKRSEQEYYVDLDELDPEFRKTLPTEGFSQLELWKKEQAAQAVPQPSGT